MKKYTFSLIMSVMLVGTSVWAVPFNGIEFVGINGGTEVDSNGFGAVPSSYWISQKEITYNQFNLSGAGSSNENVWGANGPVVNVSWHEAAKYCNWLSSGDINTGVYQISGGVVVGIDRSYRNGADMAFAIPTESEWYRAAYFNGTSFNTFANASNAAPSASAANYDSGSAWDVGSGDPELNGTYDMMGNVWEHLEAANSLASPDGVRVPINFGDASQRMVFRGGSYDPFWGVEFGDKDHWETAINGRSQEFDMLGFRVVAIPEPGTISLMSLSTVGLFLTRTVRRRKRLGISLVPIRREHLCDTFGSEREWNAGKTHEDEDYIAMLSDVLKQNMQDFWHRLTGYCGSLDRAFWNRMVLAHERKVERRIAFRATMRKKALNGLDRFLAMIMK